MTLAMRRFTAAPTVSSAPLAALVLLASLAFAYWWSREFVPAATGSLLGAYFIAPLGWAVPAVAAYGLLKRSPALLRSEMAAVDNQTILIVAAVVGCFIVALQVVVGMFSNFGSSPFSHSPRWLLTNLFFAGMPLLAIETARAAILRYGRNISLTLALVLTSLGLALLQFGVHQFTPEGLKATTEFWGGAYLPAAALGLLAGFFALYGGARAAILIAAPTTLFTYLSPFLPVVDWPILALAGVGGPAMGLWIAESLFEPEEEQTQEQHGWFSLPGVAWVLTAVMGLVIFWFSFGFFGYLPAFVPSHSMEPLIKQGDIVLTKDISPDAVQIGDIIMYEMPNRQRILHRVTDIQYTNEGKRQFIFKGDNNNSLDLYPVEDKQIRGEYVRRVPKVGWLPIKFQQALQAVR